MAVDAARAKSLFLAASDFSDAAERVAYLGRACGGDTELRGRVEALLRANDAAPLPPVGPGEATSAHASDRQPITGDYGDPTASVGSVLAGKYKLIEEIGEGGMGSVYMAQQTEPVKRAVAVKVIKAGMDSKSVLARFEAERQALAMMDHPNIARVLDAGTTDGGRPFFVMELVKGVPITQYCDERKLTPRQRLELFVPVCQAIQHAHQKGIIHRDIKPSNVLVAMYDDNPVPKVIDFGVAKAAAQALTDKTLMTGFGAVVGTPEYMSPEQANLNNMDIDTRSDVYALGVLLYELLTGSTPVDRKALAKGAYLEILRIVREVEAPKPSYKLSTSDALPSIAASRGTEPAMLSKLMRGELDWVLFKALEKDRARRYDTANGLARDIQRYLDDEVVEARPPSTSYRLQKFGRRHKGQVIAASLVLLTLVAGIVVSSYFAVLAGQEAKVARQAETKADDEARAARNAEEDAKKAETTAEKEARAARKAEANAKTAETNAAAEARAARKAEQDAKWQGRLAQDARHATQIELALRAREEKDYVRMADLIEEMRPEYQSVWETCYVRTLCCRETPLRATLTQQMGGTSSTAFSPDGKRVVTWGGYVDGTPRLWDVATGREMAALQKPPFEINGDGGFPGRLLVSSVAFSPDGKRVVAGSWNGMARVWDTETGLVKATLKGHTGIIDISVAFSPDGKLVLTGNKTMQLWDAETGQVKAILKHPGLVWRMAFSPDGKRVLTGGFDFTARLWDTETGQEKVALQGHTSIVSSVAFSPDGKRVLTGSHDGTARVWDAQTGREMTVLKEGKHQPVTRACFSPDGKRVLTGSGDNLPGSGNCTARLWDAETGRETTALKGHAGLVNSVAFGPDGQRVLTGSDDRTARVWDAATGREMAVLRHAGPVLSVAFSSDGASILTRAENDKPRVWKTEREQEKAPLKVEILVRGLFQGVALSPDGKRVLTGSLDGTARLWDAATGREMVALKGHTGPVYSVAFSPDGKRVLTGSVDKTARVWDAATGQEKVALRGHAAPVISVAFSSDGKSVVTGGYPTARLWDAETGREMNALKEHGEMVIRVGFSPDGKRVLTESTDNKVRVCDAETGGEMDALRGQKVAFSPDGRRVLTTALTSVGPARILDAETGQEKAVLKGHRGLVYSMAFSPDGKSVVTGGWDKTAVWDAETGQEKAVLKGHTGKVVSVAFSPDGKRILTGSDDGTARVWDTETGQEKIALRGHTDSVFSVAFSRDGKRVLTASFDKTARVWDAATGPEKPWPSISTK